METNGKSQKYFNISFVKKRIIYVYLCMLVLLCVHMHMCFLITEWPEEGVSLRRLPITDSEN